MNTLAIHSQVVIQNNRHLANQFAMILAIHLHVEQTHNATMVLALVCQNIKAILTLVVDLNVFWVPTVHETKLVLETNASILALELADKMLSVMSITIFQCARVQQEWVAMRLSIVRPTKLLLKQILAIHHLVVPTRNVVRTTVLQSVHVFPAISEHHQHADLNVFQTVNAYWHKHAWIRNVLTHVSVHVEFKQFVKCEITIRSAVVHLVTPEIHLSDANSR